MGLPDNSGLELFSKLPHGRYNLITDVPGVRVGHVTRKDGPVNTGVTAILPHTGNLFRDKVMANAEVINGFGKSMGLLQIKELGTIETPIIMTNTLSVGTAFTGLCRYMLAQNPDIGVTTGTVNCVVTECNDGHLNDIRGMHVEENDVSAAISNALSSGKAALKSAAIENGIDSEKSTVFSEGTDLDKGAVFEEGAVGGGTGMCCLGLKGGIGSSSRIVTLDNKEFHIGAIVMTNFGAAGNLVIGGKHYDTRMEHYAGHLEKDKGSIIMVIATDIPLSERQLGRICRRCPIALGRTGSYIGNGSGDIAIAFTTANRVPHYSDSDIQTYQCVADDSLDQVFIGAVEAVEESIISALYHAETTVGFNGHKKTGLQDFLGGTGK